MAVPAAASTPHSGPPRSPVARAVARRHNPLWRSTDAWRSRLRVLQVLGLVAAVGLSALFALVHYRDDRSVAQATEAGLHQVRAVALTGADQLHPGLGGDFTAQVRWTAVNDTAQQGRAAVGATVAPGDRVTVWLDQNGLVATAPTSAADSAGYAMVLGLLTLVGSATFLVTGSALARSHLARIDLRHWEQDWQRVAPDWTGRKRQG